MQSGKKPSTVIRTCRVAVTVLLAVQLVGCSLAFDANTLGVKASVSAPAGSNIEGTDFTVTKKAVFFLFGMVGAGRPSLGKELASQLVDGDEVVNLAISVRSRFGDLLVSLLTAGLIVPRSVTFRGTIINRQ